jgi:hypothetical protein
MLPPAARHVLSVATDLSGSAPAHGFDYAYTGMPLPETDGYVLFCTWLAPEMPRPGCVWTHALIIQNPDLAEIDDLGLLRQLFRRPKVGYFESYERQIAAELVLQNKHFNRTEYEGVSNRLIRALYASPNRSVVLSASTESHYQDLVFEIWSQQWPRLRRNFRFSTGSFGDRGRLGIPFDLQITPTTNRRAWHHERGIEIIDCDAEKTAEQRDVVEAWVTIAASDLYATHPSPFRTFLHTHGADLSDPRAKFEKLARTYIKLSKTRADKWTSVLASIATDFPESSEGLSLKRASLAPQRSQSKKYEFERDWAIIQYLEQHANNSSYANVSFDVETIVQRCWRQKKSEILDMLLTPPPANTAKWRNRLAKAVAEIVDDSDIIWLGDKHPDLLPLLVNVRPDLSSSIHVWSVAERVQWRIVEALEAHPNSANIWHRTIPAMLESQTSVAASEIVQHIGPGALDATVQWVETTGSTKLPPALWREALRPYAEQKLQTHSTSAVELIMCSLLAAASVAEAVPADRSDVQAAAKQPLSQFPLALQLPAAFFFLTIGMQASGIAACRLILRGFFPAHESLARQTEPPESWRLLQRHVPTLWFWQQWDRCEILRSAARSWLADNPECTPTFAKMTTNAAEGALFRSVLNK